MRKRFPGIIIIALFLLLTAGCGRSKIIPENKLELIFKEFFLANGYMSTHTNPTQQDSLDIYRPILKKYGYSISDLTYTFDNISKRKSVKLSDVVDRAAASLQAEMDVLTGITSDRDSLEARAVRYFSRVVFEDSTIVVNNIRDTAALRLSIPVERGSYEVGYYYIIDSLDRNGNIRSTAQIVDNAGRITQTMTNRMPERKKLTRYRTTLTADNNSHELRVLFGNYLPSSTRPNIRIDSLKVVYQPPKEVAMDSLIYRWTGHKHHIGGFKLLPDYAYPQDSVTLYPIPPGSHP